MRAGKLYSKLQKLFVVTFSDVPSEPKNAHVTKVNKDCIFVAWDRPDNDGGSPITGYAIERKERNSLLWVKANDTLVRTTEYPCVGMIEGLEYTFRICALNRAGSSKPSKPTEYVTARTPVGMYSINSQKIANLSSLQKHFNQAYRNIKLTKTVHLQILLENQKWLISPGAQFHLCGPGQSMMVAAKYLAT